MPLSETGVEEQFRCYLREQKQRFTRERRLIVREAFRIHAHFEAEELSERLRRRGEPVSRASVYRTLPLLVSSGLLREVPANGRHSHYEHVHHYEHHDHLVCTQCARIIEFHDARLERLEQEICRQVNFQPRFHKVEFHGLCAECVEQSRAEAA